jgi:GntR family transcriptional regulator
MTDEEVGLLGTKAGTEGLVYRGVIYDTTGRPVEYLVSINHPRRVSFKVTNGRLLHEVAVPAEYPEPLGHRPEPLR